MPDRTPAIMPSWSVAVAIAVVVGCMGCGSGTDDRPAKWSYISAAIIEPSCATASCHSEAAQRAGVVLTTRDTGYKSLVGRNFVIPGNPGISEVVHLMRAQGARRMPPDFPMPEADVQLIEAWIAAGAMND